MPVAFWYHVIAHINTGKYVGISFYSYLKSPERRIEKVEATNVKTLSLKSAVEKGDPPLIDNGWMRNVKQRKENRKDFSNVLELNENVKV